MSEQTEQAVRQIRDIIQDTYGDATQTVLDDRCARAIVKHLESHGWASPSVVRALVFAAGGVIDVSYAEMADPPETLVTWDDPATRRRRFRVQRETWL